MNTQGYTLIELLVVLALTIVMLITATSLFYTTLLGGGKTATYEYTKQVGQHVMNQLTFHLRNAIRLMPNVDGLTCAGEGVEMSSLALQGQDLQTTTFSLSGAKIASGAAFLTPDDVSVTDLAFICVRDTSGAPPTVTILFTLMRAGGGNARDSVSIPFQSSITLRNEN